MTAQSGPSTATDTVEAFIGTSAVLNFGVVPPPTPTPIPGLTSLGLVLLAGLLLAAILVVLRRPPRLGIAAGGLVVISAVAVLTAWPEASAVTGSTYTGLSYTERGTLDTPTPGGIEVNTFTGNLVIERSLFAIPGKGLPVHPYLTYNSDQRLITSPFGKGWSFSYNARYTKDSSGNAYIVWGDGRVDKFIFGDGMFFAPTGVYMTLAEPVSGELLLKTKRGIGYHFANGTHQKLTSIRDPNGNELTFTHDSSHRLTQITDVGGRTFTFDYDANGRLVSVTDVGLLRSYDFTYDASNRLTAIEYPMEKTETFAYDSEDLITSVTDRRSNTATITYVTPSWDADTRLPSSVAKGGSTTGLAFNQTTDTTTLTDPLSNEWKYAYDASGRITSLTDPALEAITYTWDSDRNLTGFTDRNGNSSSWTYDTSGNVLSRTDPLGKSATFTYNSIFSQMLTAQDRKGNTTTHIYDANGNRTQTTDPLSNAILRTFDGAGQMTARTDRNSNTTNLTYNTNGNVASITDPLSNLTQFAYDAASRLTQVTDANSNVTAYAYDQLDRLSSISDALGNADLRGYDANNNLVSYKDRNLNITTYAYDSLNRLTVVTDALSNADGRAYDANGNLTSYADRNSNVTTYPYDSLNRRTVVTDALSNADARAYDANGNLTSYTDRNSNVTIYAYDALDRRTVVTDALSNADARAFDASGNLTSYTDRNSNVTTYAYDALDRLTVVTDALSNADARAYDANGNRTTYTDRRGNSWTSTYDALNRVINRTNPLSNTWSYAYDANSNLVTHTDAKTQVTTATYDALNRLTGQGFADATSATFTYDAVSNLLTAVDAESSYTYVYDSLDRRTLLTDNPLAKSVTYAHDPVGRLTSKTGPEGDVVTYAYDAASRLTSLTEGAGTSAFTYDAAGNTLTDARPNGLTSTFTYNANNRVASIAHNNPALKQSFSYTGDANGWVTQTGRVLSENLVTFTRDALGRITQETGGVIPPPPQTNYVRDYTYDANGNQTRLVSTTASGVVDTVLTIDDANRPVTQTEVGVGTTAHAYDANGSRTTSTLSGGTETWGVDAQNRVVSWNDGAGSTVDYTYDVMDRMIRRIDSSGADRRTMYGSNTPVAEDSDGNGSLDTTYTTRTQEEWQRERQSERLREMRREREIAMIGSLTIVLFPYLPDRSSRGSAPAGLSWRVGTQMFFPGSPVGPEPGVCPETQGLLTGIASSCASSCGEIATDYVSPDCNPVESVSAGLSWRVDTGMFFPGSPLEPARQRPGAIHLGHSGGRVASNGLFMWLGNWLTPIFFPGRPGSVIPELHSATGFLTVHSGMGGNTGANLNTVGSDPSGNTSIFIGDAYIDGIIRDFASFAAAGLPLADTVALPPGVRIDPLTGLPIGRPSTGTVHHPPTRTTITVGGLAGASTPDTTIHPDRLTHTNLSIAVSEELPYDYYDDEKSSWELFLFGIDLLAAHPGALKEVFGRAHLIHDR